MDAGEDIGIPAAGIRAGVDLVVAVLAEDSAGSAAARAAAAGRAGDGKVQKLSGYQGYPGLGDQLIRKSGTKNK